MTIELDSTLAQAEVLFLSFAQLVADVDRRHAEDGLATSGNIRRRINATDSSTESGERQEPSKRSIISDDLRGLLAAGR